MNKAFFTQSGAYLRFVTHHGGLWRTSVLPLAILASAARTGLIYAINEAAARGGLNLMQGFWLLLVLVVSLIAAHLARVKSFALVEGLVLQLRQALADNLLKANVGFFQERPQGEVFTALTSHAEQVGEGALQLVRTIEALALFGFCLIYMFTQSWPAGIATFATLIIGVACFFLTDLAARKILVRANAARVAMHETVQDIIGGYRELRLRQDKREEIAEEARKTTREVKDAVLGAERMFSFGQVSSTTALAGLLAAIVVLLPAFSGANSVDVLQLLTVVLFAFGPIELVIGNLPAFGRATVAYQRICDILNASAREAEQSGAIHGAPNSGFRTIELRGITATLHRPTKAAGGSATDQFTLGPVDLTLVPGQSLFITGGNGTGKSTLLQILTGLRQPDSGQILVDGQPVDWADVAAYRGLFAAVFSEFYLFRRLYGLTPDEKRLVQDRIADLGLSGHVDLDGDAFSNLALSTGQMRRLALAIALAEARPVIILDEFAADQDPARRRFFYDTLVSELAGKGHCVVAVTHDEHCFDRADRLIRMEDGKIVYDSTRGESSA